MLHDLKEIPQGLNADRHCHDADGAPLGRHPPVIQDRADFLRAAAARRYPAAGLLLQAYARQDDLPFRVGYTCSKKIGNAVKRNRAKRRLRAIVRAVFPETARRGWDYVLIGRPEATIARDFTSLCTDLRQAMMKIHDVPPGGGRKPRRK